MKSESLTSGLTNLIGQNYCFYCGEIDEIICSQCLIALFSTPEIKYLNSVPVLYFQKNNKTISKLITSFKDDNLTVLERPFSLIIAVGLKYFSNRKRMNVVNVPTSLENINKRGKDPVANMTATACKAAGQRFYFNPDLLSNKKQRKDQSKLSFPERKLNLNNAFESRIKVKEPIILVDDLITTGQSLLECIKSLQEKGNTVNSCVVIAAN
jgi:predicted amidophosphoribosyltransferase